MTQRLIEEQQHHAQQLLDQQQKHNVDVDQQQVHHRDQQNFVYKLNTTAAVARPTASNK